MMTAKPTQPEMPESSQTCGESGTKGWLGSLAQYGPSWLKMRSMSDRLTSKMYDIWATFYDYTFAALVTRRQRHAVQHLGAQPGETILDLGTGTGITLPMQRRDVTVVGMDLSAGMLGKARERCEKLSLGHCKLVRGDAMLPPFADRSFDHVLIAHTISVVSDPGMLLEWAERLVKPGGHIVVLNHFQSSSPFIGWFERVLNPMFVRIGWKSDLALEDVLTRSKLRVAYRFKLGLFDLWQIVVLTDEVPATTGDGCKAGQPGTAQENTTSTVDAPPRGAQLAIHSGQ